jgi:hypothetical protein
MHSTRVLLLSSRMSAKLEEMVEFWKRVGMDFIAGLGLEYQERYKRSAFGRERAGFLYRGDYMEILQGQ